MEHCAKSRCSHSGILHLPAPLTLPHGLVAQPLHVMCLPWVSGTPGQLVGGVRPNPSNEREELIADSGCDGVEVDWEGYGKESARPAIGKLHVGVRGRQPCALTSLQPLLNLSKLDLKE